MPINFKKEDLRVRKTYSSLLEAFPKLLNKRDFNRITVNDICEDAQISRAAFYTHFNDKFSLLEYWLKQIANELKHLNFLEIGEIANEYVKDNPRTIVNLLDGALKEVWSILQEFIVSILKIDTVNEHTKKTYKYLALCNFCAGGIINSLYWQIQHSFPKEIPLVGEEIQQVIKFVLVELNVVEKL